ncbi:MAG: hypothetical protein JKY80_06990 [Mariprofundaceae bacterium]|nr:hypothetical protein [Mariprofundaceae bacterium]
MKFLIIGFISLVLLPISITAAAIFIVASIVLMILAKNLANSVTQEQMDEAYSEENLRRDRKIIEDLEETFDYGYQDYPGINRHFLSDD